MTADLLAHTRRLLHASDPTVTPAMGSLAAQSQAALLRGPYTVVSKSLTPPSGDKHDYMSVGPYWWPNPDTRDGLPYVRRDGEVNPERHTGAHDYASLAGLIEDVQVTLLAHALAGDHDAGAHASTLLRTWFLKPATRMNPHLRFGQAVPGITHGRGIGIIDTAALVDLVRLLRVAPPTHWTHEDSAGLKTWFSDYLDWLLASDLGQQECREHNNHGTWWDAQAAWFAIYCGRPVVAREIVNQVLDRRIAPHLAPDGSQPHELARTRPVTYSCFNLQALLHLADAGDEVGVDLRGAATSDGRSLRKGLEWMIRYASAAPTQLDGPDARQKALAPLLRRAALAYAEPKFEAAIAAIPNTRDARFNLLYPAM